MLLCLNLKQVYKQLYNRRRLFFIFRVPTWVYRLLLYIYKRQNRKVLKFLFNKQKRDENHFRFPLLFSKYSKNVVGLFYRSADWYSTQSATFQVSYLGSYLINFFFYYLYILKYRLFQSLERKFRSKDNQISIKINMTFSLNIRKIINLFNTATWGE